MKPAPRRNDPCPCGGGRKFKQCCLAAWEADAAKRNRLRAAEGRVINELLDNVLDVFGRPFFEHAWDEFWGYPDEVPGLEEGPEFESMFIPWFVLGFVADPHAEGADPEWPTVPLGLYWLEHRQPPMDESDRRWTTTACRSPTSVFIVEKAEPCRSLDLRDLLTGARFHVLDEKASAALAAGQIIFTRIVTIDEVSVMLGLSPWVVPAGWDTAVEAWRQETFHGRLPTRNDLEDFDIEIHDLYLELTDRLLGQDEPRDD